jgi:hypothetical protein
LLSLVRTSRELIALVIAIADGPEHAGGTFGRAHVTSLATRTGGRQNHVKRRVVRSDGASRRLPGMRSRHPR